ncbi:MAG: hypothetical protein SV686_13155 [Thermodesulfobacteriota bacterium]|nr:hypothetical protein [Thermodesulfobacteriota bacterium]
MKKAKSMIMLLVSVCILALVFAAVRPYWNKYWLTKDLEAVAVYGTKKSIEEIKKKLDRVMKEQGHGFVGNDFYIQKDKHRNVTIGIEYYDEISLFSLIIKELEMEVETKAYYREEWL